MKPSPSIAFSVIAVLSQLTIFQAFGASQQGLPTKAATTEPPPVSHLVWKSVEVAGPVGSSYTRTEVAQIPEGYLLKVFGPDEFHVVFIPDPSHSWNPGEFDPLNPTFPLFDGNLLRLHQNADPHEEVAIRWLSVAAIKSQRDGTAVVTLLNGDSITVSERYGDILGAIAGR
jgi:hypothetical protein